jgi:hypothetical protein
MAWTNAVGSLRDDYAKQNNLSPPSNTENSHRDVASIMSNSVANFSRTTTADTQQQATPQPVIASTTTRRVDSEQHLFNPIRQQQWLNAIHHAIGEYRVTRSWQPHDTDRWQQSRQQPIPRKNRNIQPDPAGIIGNNNEYRYISEPAEYIYLDRDSSTPVSEVTVDDSDINTDDEKKNNNNNYYYNDDDNIDTYTQKGHRGRHHHHHHHRGQHHDYRRRRQRRRFSHHDHRPLFRVATPGVVMAPILDNEDDDNDGHGADGVEDDERSVTSLDLLFEYLTCNQIHALPKNNKKQNQVDKSSSSSSSPLLVRHDKHPLKLTSKCSPNHQQQPITTIKHMNNIMDDRSSQSS